MALLMSGAEGPTSYSSSDSRTPSTTGPTKSGGTISPGLVEENTPSICPPRQRSGLATDCIGKGGATSSDANGCATNAPARSCMVAAVEPHGTGPEGDASP